jgi:hypothetical protein
MILSFALVMCLPDDIEQITETLNQIEELMQCFKNLHLGEAANKKQMKSKGDEERGEALHILFDLMISLLARSHSFLRETANYVFKSFCSDLDEDSLDQLIKIISTPNEKASEMFEQGSDDEDYGEESGDDKEVDISEDSDDSI